MGCMEIVGSYYFEGAAYLVVVQLVLIAVLNLISGKRHNILLGLLLILFADAIRNSFLYSYLSQPDIKVIIGNLHLNIFFGPLIYMYIRSVTQRVRANFLLIHFTFPGVYTFGVLSIALLNYYQLAEIRPNIYLYETKFTLFVFYLGLTIRFTETIVWKNTKHRSRYRTFLILLVAFILFNLSDLIFWKYQYELRLGLASFFFYLNVTFYILTSVFLVYHGITELNWLKNFFVTAQGNRYDNHASIFDEIQKKLHELFTKDKIHTILDLDLNMLSNAVGVKKQLISDYLNIRERKSFHELINERRVAEFKKNLIRSDLKHLDILGIAYESGFSSKSTFNRVFKKVEGITPREYKALMESKG
ncbi:MAG: helix-turn-helix domain-containing protein, partial [Bacteroidota bacterium]